MKRFFTLYLTLFLIISVKSLTAQVTFPINGVADPREQGTVIINANIHQDSKTVCSGCMLLIEKGKIKAIGKQLNIPEGMVSVDLKGQHIYPSFIEIYSNYGLSEGAEASRPAGGRGRVVQYDSNRKGAYGWNDALKTDYNAFENFTIEAKQASDLRKLGFGTVSTHKMDGMSRGTAAAIMLGEEKDNLEILKNQTAHHLSFNKGSSTQNYPSSLAGGIALLRQTYLDARWYQQQGIKEQTNLTLEAWNKVQALPQIFEVSDKQEMLRAAAIAKENNSKYIFVGVNDAYQKLDEIKKTGSSLIVNLNFPEAYDVESPFDALQVSLADMLHWEWAPWNPGKLVKAGIPIAITLHGLKDKKDFMKKLRQALESGLDEADAIHALTAAPAQMLGIFDQVGSLHPGKWANFIVTKGPVFEEKSSILQNYIRGNAFVISEDPAQLTPGTYDLISGGMSRILEVKKTDKGTDVSILVDTSSIKVTYQQTGQQISMHWSEANQPLQQIYALEVENGFKGQIQSGQGAWSAVEAKLKAAQEPTPEKTSDKVPATEPMVLRQPFNGYGWTTQPGQETVLIRNATVWTNTKDGIITETDVLIEAGKIKRIGKNLSASGAILVDGSNKHLTAGIIDEHSHIALSRGVNEGTQASTAEVRMGDVINAEDVNIYRQLAGGVTAVQLLHGSANPVGGQAQLIKLRWGWLPEEMKFEGADPFIKFALGENVKQSNFGDGFNIRFPQSRMGVEQVYQDLFTRAKEYETLKKSGKPYRVDLETETILEILNSKRYISCHSYVQSEINMLMKVANTFGFKVNTFTHILEGYKVADKMHEHGAGASSFSDWWAYKMEVKDAIPYNGLLLQEQGVVVAFNSDDAEMARRLNQEAGKAVMYGGMSEEDAWKLVTLNPAKLLHVDKRVGSVEVGKDADIVLWSANPLSIYAKAEKTYVDGRLLFDREQDEQKRIEIAKERERLIRKMIQLKKGGNKTQGVRPQREHHYHCDDILDEMTQYKD